MKKFRISCLSTNGSLIFETRISSSGVCLVSNDQASDLVVSTIGSDVYLLQEASNGIQVQKKSGSSFVKSILVKPGKIVKGFGCSWMVCEGGQDPRERSTSVDGIDSVQTWLSTSVQKSTDVPSALNSLLEIVLQETGANAGFVVLNEPSGKRLLTKQGLMDADVIRYLDCIPENLDNSLLTETKTLILPSELSRLSSAKTTVFLDGLGDVVGVPLSAEGCIFAILYIRFKNVVGELDEQKRNFLTLLSSVGGVVVQRAYLREQLSEISMLKSDSSHDGRLMVGQSDFLQALYQQIQKIGPTRLSVLIEGPTGTGKELVAKELHRMSDRSKGPFVAVNAAALPESLLEAELFGYKRGSFSGAISDKRGLIEQAHGGTLFLDEIAELPLAAQSKLLRVLQEKVVTRIGEERSRQVDFRIVAATHGSLSLMVQQKTFREDLYYRIATTTLRTLPLKDRAEDIPLLAKYFLKKMIQSHNLPMREFTEQSYQFMCNRSWPGNIRELINVVERSAVVAEGRFISVKDLDPESLFCREQIESRVGWDDVQPLNIAKKKWLKEYLTFVLNRSNGNKAKAAKDLEISSRTLFRYLENFSFEHVENLKEDSFDDNSYTH